MSWFADDTYGIGICTGPAFDLVVVDVDDEEGERLIVESCGHELQTDDLCERILQRDAIRIEVRIAPAPLEGLALCVTEMSDQDLLCVRQRTPEPSSSHRHAVPQSSVHRFKVS